MSKKILSHYQIKPEKKKLNLFVRRGSVSDQRIFNENEVFHYLNQRAGYIAVDTGILSYKEQVGLFASANNIVGMHGGGLTNTMFGDKVNLLEFAALGHGWRADFFPFVRATGGHLALVGLKSRNESNDVIIPEKVLAWWIAQEKIDSNFAISSSFDF